MRLRDFLEAAQALATDPDPPNVIIVHPDTFAALTRRVSGEFALKRSGDGTWTVFGLPFHGARGVHPEKIWPYHEETTKTVTAERPAVNHEKHDVDPRAIARCFVHEDCQESAALGRACWEARSEGDSWTR